MRNIFEKRSFIEILKLRNFLLPLVDGFSHFLNSGRIIRRIDGNKFLCQTIEYFKLLLILMQLSVEGLEYETIIRKKISKNNNNRYRYHIKFRRIDYIMSRSHL